MKPRIRVVNAGFGNAFSLRQAFLRQGAKLVEKDADGLVLPGVGAFDAGAEMLGTSLREELVSGKPVLGICLGMQLLFRSSEEGDRKGLGLIPGRVRRLDAPILPHLGWNTVQFKDSVLGEGITSPWFYFLHSYVCPKNRWTAGWTTFETRFSSVVEKDNLFGVQFHPEKSGKSGAALIGNFLEAVRAWK